ncbi:hypothetical protein DBB42_23765 [Pseudomonas plecoglossicida]|uniref:KAP NTPase domain-containing protein n=1 Tax=Pseudomonas plecoglossicida TaxID=70775 RepID=A0A2R7UE07_PSEDL|nr:hypothetical protein [Pseudomonas plecoglossicida]PTU49695.1 hypothetical protein DBB42_23765 [Pseudomonas plecoglossicida]
MDTSVKGSTDIPAVIIDLDQSDRNKPVASTELIQRHRYEELRGQVDAHLRSLESPLFRAMYPAGSGWALFVDGTRGAGKSTFLSSVASGLVADSTIKSRLSFVAMIDPSRVEHSEIILLVILQHLKKKISEVIGRERTLEHERLHEEWRVAFKRVAGGLTLLAREHHPLNDLDADLFLDWGLERAGDSANLRANLHQLFATACNLLGVQAIMIAFDDADTDATHAINLLECIRKYLDTPQVMVVVTGDMELYSLLVRQHFAKSLAYKASGTVNADRSFLERDRAQQYSRMLGHLEEQYLLKLFPVRRRLQLLPMWNLLQRATEGGNRYLITCKAWGDSPREARALVDELVARGLRVKALPDIDLYREFLLKQPLRSVLQVLSHCAPHLTGSAGTVGASWSRELTEALTRGLQALALTSLYKFSVDTDAISVRELPALSEAVFQLSLLDGDVDTAAYLRPTSAQQDIKNCFVALAAEVPNFSTGKPGMLIRYLFTGPGSVTLYDLVRKRKINDSEESAEALARQFQRFVGIGRKENALDWARHATAIIAAPYGVNPKFGVVRVGVIGLSRKKPPSASQDQQTAKAAIRTALESSSENRFPILALSLVDVSGTGIRTYASILNIVGLIERLLELEEPKLDDIKAALGRASPTLSISSPVWEPGGNAEDLPDSGSDETSLSSDTPQDEQLKTLAESIEAWLGDVKLLSPRISPSGVLVGKIWTRLFFSLEKAADELRGQAGVAVMMEIFALCVINAFMVEEADHHMSDSIQLERRGAADRTNPVESASTFVKKLMRVSPSRDDLPLTAIIATCPLLLGLLNSKESYSASLIKLFPEERQIQGYIESLLCSSALWESFNRISVTGRSRQVRAEGEDIDEVTVTKTPKRSAGGRKSTTVEPGDAHEKTITDNKE